MLKCIFSIEQVHFGKFKPYNYYYCINVHSIEIMLKFSTIKNRYKMSKLATRVHL